MSKNKEQNLEIQVENQNKLRELEQFYNTGTIDTMLDTIEERKKELVDKISKYSREHLKVVKWDEEGNPLEYEVTLNPLVISNYFFKPIIPIAGQEPIYNAEKLGLVFDYYCEILAEVNDKIGNYPSSLTSFCRFAGLTLNTLRNYRKSSDYSMKTVVEKIYDQIGDENITMSQMGITKERSTIFKMKSQNELVEKQQPNININLTEKPDMEMITARIDKYKYFANKKDK